MNNSISAHVVQAAEFVQRQHFRLTIDHPAMAVAVDTLKAAGVWSLSDLDLPADFEPPKVAMVMKGTFCAGDRRRIVYRLTVDDLDIGTAVCWTSKTLWPWGLSIPAANIINFGFKSREALIEAVKRFAVTGSIHHG